jgi:2-succinyl-5-enolpyruvyl-6-hydroxy-3-cyclohexene-1-carboxylate synthase
MGAVNPSTAQATVLVDELIAGGVTEAVLCPGSRNAPLSMALHAADAAGRIRLHVRIDERTAGFLALGLARGSGGPAAVATTSGTAVANLHPAVLEAWHGGIPLVVLSADRPPELRDVGANQVIDQRSVFGGGVRFFHDFGLARPAVGQNAYWRSMVCRALLASRGTATGRPGPVQLNIPLTEPLLPDGDEAWPESLAGRGAWPESLAGRGAWPESLAGRGGPWTRIETASVPDWEAGRAVPAPGSGERCLFVAEFGHPWAAGIAARGFPVVAEAGGLGGSSVLGCGVHLLGDEHFRRLHRPERVVVLGRPTLFRAITSLLSDPAVRVDVVAPTVDHPDPSGNASLVAPWLAPLVEPPDADWAAAWRAADRTASTAVAAVLRDHDVATSAVLARSLTRALPGGATLVVASSQPPRDLGMFAEARDGVRVVANRGVAGIDGLVSTSIGVALAPGTAPAYALLGDLAFLHDVTGLAIGPHEPRPDLTVVVANNDGGGIFGPLEPGAPQHATAFERVFGTPTGAGLASIVEGFGAEHLLAVTADELVDAIAAPPSGIRVVEVPVTRTELRALLGEVRSAVGAALAR